MTRSDEEIASESHDVRLDRNPQGAALETFSRRSSLDVALRAAWRSSVRSRLLLFAAAASAWCARTGDDAFPLLMLGLGLARAWGGARLLLEERQIGMLGQVFVCPPGTRSIVRSATLHESLVTLGLAPCAVLGATIVTGFGGAGSSLDAVARDAWRAALLSGLVWAIATRATLDADFVVSVGTAALSIPAAFLLDRMAVSPMADAAIWTLAIIVTAALAVGIEHVSEEDSWRLRSVRS